MKQVLSQQEIDSLLNALDTGEIDTDTLKKESEDKVRSYDFRRPIKLSKEYVNTLYMVFENFSKIVGNLLSSQIHTNVDVELGAVEQISYDEFIRSIPKTTLLGIFHTKPLKGVQLIEINPQFCMQAVEFTCGGIDSYDSKRKIEKNEFTDIELGVLGGVVRNILDSFEGAWKEVVEIKTEVDYLETNPQLVQSMSPNEPVILISFSLVVERVRSFMNICIPFVSFENIMDKLSFRNWFDFDKKPDKEDRKVLEERVVSAEIELSVEIGETIIDVDDFLHLDNGDVLMLNTKITDPLKMKIEGKPHYLVKPGKYNDKLAVEVLQYIEEDVD